MNIELHPSQSDIIRDLFVEKTNRYGVVCASRGFGKSYLAAVSAMLAVQELMQLPETVPNKNVSIVAPTYQQTVDIYYPLLAYQLGLADWALTHSAYTGKFTFPNNVELRLWSYEASERMRGSGQYFVVCDEVVSWEGNPGLEESWSSIIRPCITTRWSADAARRFNAPSPGRALIISTPKGYDHFYDMFNYQDVDKDWKSYHYSYHNSPYLSAEEIEKVKLTVDPLKFAREYEASFEDSGANVFYNFSRSDHLDPTIEWPEENEVIFLGIDFNVGIQATSAFYKRGESVYYFDEFMGHPDTDSLAKAIKARYPNNPIRAFPDPSGRSRKTSAVGATDFSILEQHGIRCLARKKAPAIADSVQAVNTKLKNAKGEVHIKFDPKRCEKTVKSMERTLWLDSNPDSLVIDKRSGDEHFSDGIRYAIEYLFPVTGGKKRVITGNRLI